MVKVFANTQSCYQTEKFGIVDDLENCTNLLDKTNQLKKQKDKTLLKETKKKLQLIQKEYDLLLSTTMTTKTKLTIKYINFTSDKVSYDNNCKSVC